MSEHEPLVANGTEDDVRIEKDLIDFSRQSGNSSLSFR
jgi:hypothetical protein